MIVKLTVLKSYHSNVNITTKKAKVRNVNSTPKRTHCFKTISTLSSTRRKEGGLECISS